MSHFDLVRTHRPAALEHAHRGWLASNIRERLLAFAVDVGVFIISAPFLLGFCAVVLQDYWVFGAIAAVSVYAAGSWALFSRTFGMAVARIALVDERTRRCPSVPQAVMRTALTVSS